MAPEALTTSSTRLRSLSSWGVVKALMVPVMLVLSAWMLGEPGPAAEGDCLLQGSPQLWCSRGSDSACGSMQSAQLLANLCPCRATRCAWTRAWSVVGGSQCGVCVSVGMDVGEPLGLQGSPTHRLAAGLPADMLPASTSASAMAKQCHVKVSVYCGGPAQRPGSACPSVVRHSNMAGSQQRAPHLRLQGRPKRRHDPTAGRAWLLAQSGSACSLLAAGRALSSPADRLDQSAADDEHAGRQQQVC